MKNDYEEGWNAYQIGYGFDPNFKTEAFMMGYLAAKAVYEETKDMSKQFVISDTHFGSFDHSGRDS